jgi:hypothetical protein
MILYLWNGEPVYAAGTGSKRIPCEVYSRIVGYMRPVQQWNVGKQQEFVDRRPYGIPRDRALNGALHK